MDHDGKNSKGTHGAVERCVKSIFQIFVDTSFGAGRGLATMSPTFTIPTISRVLWARLTRVGMAWIYLG